MDWLRAYNVADLPEGVLPVSGVQMLGFLSSEGEECWTWRTDGQVNTTDLLGMLEIMKAEIIAAAMSPEEEDASE